MVTKCSWCIKVISLINMMVFASCVNNDEGNKNLLLPRQLFSQSAEILNDEIKNIFNMRDSLEVDSLHEALEKKLVDINFSYPPETDLLLTEQENDSLFKLLSVFRNIKEEKLKEFHINKTDTIENEIEKKEKA